MRTLVCLFAAHLTVSIAAAQTTPPPRDAGRPGPGSATIRGRIVDSVTGRPIAGAIVRPGRRAATVPAGGEPLQAITGADGRYEFAGLPAGEYTVIAGPPEQSATYLHGLFGSAQPLEAWPSPLSAPPLEIAPGETREGVDVALVRALAIEGRVVNEFGEPLADVSVTAESVSRGFPGLMPASTDDRGVFRVFGLAPGTYRVCAKPEGWGGPTQGDDAAEQRIVRTCHPAAVAESLSEPITIKGADASGLLIQMQRSGTFTAAGRVIDESGVPATDARVSLYQFDRRGGGGSTAQQPETRSGAFVIRGLTPGEYVIVAAAGHSTDPYEREARERGTHTLRVESSDISGLVIRTTSGADVVGRVVFDGTIPPPAARLVARTTSTGTAHRFVGQPAASPVRDDGIFELKRLFGPWTFSLSGLPAGWVIGSVRFKGEDITDLAVEFTSSSEAKDFEVRVTNRTAAITARAVDDKGAPVPTAFVMLLPADARRWSGGVLLIGGPPGAARDGKRTVRPGEYLVAALPFEDVVTRMFDQSDLHAAVAKVAQRITLAAGDDRTVDARVIRLAEIK